MKTLKSSIFVLYTDENYFEPRIWTIKVVMLILLGKNSDLFGNEYFVLDLWLYINYVNIYKYLIFFIIEFFLLL